MRYFLTLAAGLGASLATAALADEPTSILRANNQVSADFQSLDTHYTETVFGASADSETGSVSRGFSTSLSLMHNFGVENLYLRGSFARYEGHTNYTGQLLVGGGYGSVLTTDGATITDTDFRIGKGFTLGRDLMFTPFLGAGTDAWNRGVNNGEKYSHDYWGLGAMLQWAPFAGKLVISGDGMIGEAFNSQVQVASIPEIGIQGATLALGSAATYRASLGADYAVTDLVHVNGGVDWTQFSYRASALDPTQTYYEPSSSTSNLTYHAGLGVSFY